MPTCNRLGQTCPLQPPSHRRQGRGCQVSEALLLLFIFSRGGRASGLKAACQKGSLYPPILLLETPSLVFALKGPKGTRLVKHPLQREWGPVPEDALCARATLSAPFEIAESPKPIPAHLPVSPQWQSDVSWTLSPEAVRGCPSASHLLQPSHLPSSTQQSQGMQESRSFPFRDL